MSISKPSTGDSTTRLNPKTYLSIFTAFFVLRSHDISVVTATFACSPLVVLVSQ
jgi:hypothetical protein